MALSQFQEYVAHGWKICKIEPLTKGPRTEGWNRIENAVKDASGLQGAGLMHAYSGTCALDLDRLDDAAVWLSGKGINLSDLLNAPDAVQIVSGRPNRGKLIYALSTPLPSKSLCEGAFELRCCAATGRTMQDVLPPTIHPDTGAPYQWKGDWRAVPPIPAALLSLWQSLTGSGVAAVSIPKTQRNGAVLSGVPSELKSLLARRDPDCGYDEWLRIGMALHHESEGSDEGLGIWDEFSAPSDKYPGLEALRSHWQSFGRSATPITADSLRRSDRAAVTDFETVTAPTDANDPGVERSDIGFAFLSLGELFERPEPKWIINGILPEAAFGVTYGQPGAGKTFTSVDMALAIALGQPWRGRKVKQGAILYIAAEDDRGVQMRLAAGLASRGVQDAPIRVLPAAPVLTDKGQANRLLEAIKRESRPSIVFFDTLAAVTPGSDENTSKDMGGLIHYCYQIHKAVGALVMLIHHEGKVVGSGMRGSSTLLGACDVSWEISKDDLHHEMRIEKLKNAPDGMSYSFNLLPFGNSCVVEWI